MKIKSIKEQLIDMGLKHGDRINVKGYMYNPYIINFKTEELEDMDGHCDSLEELIGCEFEKVAPTKEELIEELKKRSKKFEKGEFNCRILYSFDLQMVIWSGTYFYLDLSELYFTKGEANKICVELNADPEKVKILFDLEE